MQSVKAGQRMADQSRHGHLERDTEQVDFLYIFVLIVDWSTWRFFFFSHVRKYFCGCRWGPFPVFLLQVVFYMHT